MSWVFNPFTGKLDEANKPTGWKFNPFTGNFDRLGNTGGWVFNPFTGALDSVAGAPVPPGGNILYWGANDLTWGAAGQLGWGA